MTTDIGKLRSLENDGRANVFISTINIRQSCVHIGNDSSDNFFIVLLHETIALLRKSGEFNGLTCFIDSAINN